MDGSLIYATGLATVGELVGDDAGPRVGGFAFNIRCRSVVMAEL